MHASATLYGTWFVLGLVLIHEHNNGFSVPCSPRKLDRSAADLGVRITGNPAQMILVRQIAGISVNRSHGGQAVLSALADQLQRRSSRKRLATLSHDNYRW